MRISKTIPIVLVVLIACSAFYLTSVSANDAASSAAVPNAAPAVEVGLAPDDDPATSGVQVINPDWESRNRAVTITADVVDMNGWDDLTGTVTAEITGPGVVEDSPVSLTFDHEIDVTTAVYTGVFNMSDHAEGDYTVIITADDAGGLSGTGQESFTYFHTAGDVTPPNVANPVADPASIVADGVEGSELSVDVTDASGIYAVTIDLSSIGGNHEQPMTSIAGTDAYTTTTTAAVGTTPGMYGLPVTATDDSPNRNTNTAVNILLTVMPQEVVTTYDFTTGAGGDRWAFRKQYGAKPPATSKVPAIEFTQSKYEKIMADDSTMQTDRTSANGKYAIHRFKFSIDEPESSITEINILWNGVGYHYWDTGGATLYIWNVESGCYEKLSSSFSTHLTLEGSITENIVDYIDDSGSLTIIAEQNTPQRKFWRWVLRSSIGTDYVRVDVTCTLQPDMVVLDITPDDTEVHPGDEMTFAVDIRNDGASAYGYIGGAAHYPDGTYCNTEWKKTDYLDTGDTATVHLGWTVPADASHGQYGFVSATWDACRAGCEDSPYYLDGCCDGEQNRYDAANLFEVVS
ncbi:MAG: hypothetical protein EF813_06390 [Methanosarcinales archaeon]|nr:MAG: hypothetical protein EF813_06390 [Methanosarcinales archaeon]